ncbi:MAG: beta-propeller fold lactonase family protein [Holophagales bacterium]|nr:beta-propeller fold lactonase family protein [Holophagales bacterium]
MPPRASPSGPTWERTGWWSTGLTALRTLEPNDPGGLALAPGSGPRHLAWHPCGSTVYLLTELSATVASLGFDAGRGSLELLQTVPARADGASAENLAAAIAVSPDGRFLYTSNRGDDDLAVFAIDGHSLRLAPAGRVPSGGRGPRSFALDPSGRWLVTANQGSGSLVVFRRDPATGLPAAVGAPVAVPEPVCVLFAPEVPAGGRNQNSRLVAPAEHDRAPGARKPERGWRPR